MDQDEAQEFATLVLEGIPVPLARKMARSANDRINSKRLSGPRSPDKNGHGKVPYISDTTIADWRDPSGRFQNVQSFTQDTRTDMEREQDWSLRDVVDGHLALVSERQRTALTIKYGLDTGEIVSEREVARQMGITLDQAQGLLSKGRKRIRTHVTKVTEMEGAGF